MATDSSSAPSRVNGQSKALLVAAESLCLLAAIALTIPPPPSEVSHVFYFFPGGATAVALFAVSRVIRHWSAGGSTLQWVLCVVEVVGFFAFAIIMTTVANMLFAR